MHRLTPHFAWLGGLALGGAALAQAPEPPPRPFLRKVIQLNDAQLAAMERGEVVTKQLTTTDKVEVAAFGVVKVKGAIDSLLEKARDPQNFRKVPEIPEIGRFSTPPRVEDLQGLTWPDPDLDALKACKPGKCDVKVGTAGLERLKEINWSDPGARAKLVALIREQMTAYAKAYQEGGTDAMGTAVDKAKPKALSVEFRELLKNSPYLAEYVEPFHAYLEAYPKGSLPQTTDVLYWAKDTFGLKPVVSIYHATVHKGDRGVLLANKQIYASHYFNAGLEIIAAVDSPDAGSFYLLDLYRTRIDPPTGMLAGVLLGKVKGGVEQGVALNLKNAKSKVEAR